MAKIPSDNRFDSTLELLRDPYRFIGNRCRLLHSNVVETRLMLQPTILLQGKDAAEVFYDSTRFIRKGAAPNPVRKTLFGVGGIQGTDGTEHVKRKQMFLSILSETQVDKLRRTFREDLVNRMQVWASSDRICLFDELKLVLCKSACNWAGVSIAKDELEKRTKQIASLFDRSNSSITSHIKARWNRTLLERWAAEKVVQARTQRNDTVDETPLQVIAHYEDSEGRLLNRSTAAVELLNVIRPIVAVSVYMLFGVLALHDYPRAKQDAVNSKHGLRNFVQEVRRFYPFFPAVAARVRDDFRWNDYDFPKGRRVMLDLYGTNHDPNIFSDPQEFRPERFETNEPGTFSFVPQGGGDPQVTHRCPGEDVAITLTASLIEAFISGLEYHIHKQDLQLKFNRLPAIPHSGIILSNVKVPAQF